MPPQQVSLVVRRRDEGMDGTRKTPRWKTPAEDTNVSLADRIEVFAIRGQDIVPAEGWPARFWDHVDGRRFLSRGDAELIVSLFCGLEPGVSARCHTPPWGLAFYKGDDLLFSATICFRCSNVYVYTAQGKDLRAFNVKGANASKLRKTLERVTKTSE
jgi:hypothetical protein